MLVSRSSTELDAGRGAAKKGGSARRTPYGYELHDVGGYDSLFPGDAKLQVREAGGGEDPSPPANGNIVFVKRIETAVNLGAKYIVVSPEVPGRIMTTAACSAFTRDGSKDFREPFRKSHGASRGGAVL
jgi:hypothetical protein